MTTGRRARVRTLTFPGAAGSLEGILRTPPGRTREAALLCHPHPLYGGSMHSPVIFRAARALHRSGIATFRFNFRGVGRSAGSFDSGSGERDDVRAALDLLSSEIPGVPVILLGYSFGSRVGFEAAGGDFRVTRLIGIGVPLDLYDFGFLEKIRKPILLFQGALDSFGTLARVRELAGRLGRRAQLLEVPGADHHFTGKLDELEERIAAELRAQ